MIRDHNAKVKKITQAIKTRMPEFNQRYRNGPSLYFYKRVLSLRRSSPDIGSFLSCDYHLEILYAVLVSWDMNSRGAKLKDFGDFKSNILACMPDLHALDKASKNLDIAKTDVYLDLLTTAFSNFALMQTASRLVSSSKCLHFLFPSLCMPMDRINTLQYLYGNNNESHNKYREISAFCFDVMAQPIDFEPYLDDQWNQTIPKLVDNAIILLKGKSVK